jgi:hypothetical protein
VFTVTLGQVFLWERIWRIFKGGKANDGGYLGSWCTNQQIYELEFHQLEEGEYICQKTTDAYLKGC